MSNSLRTFSTGATRDNDVEKPDYEACLSPLALEAYAAYMQRHAHLPNGETRPTDNWQKGFPLPTWMKSLWRHFVHAWKLHRGWPTFDERGRDVNIEDALCGIIFNANGYLHTLKENELRRQGFIGDVVPKP